MTTCTPPPRRTGLFDLPRELRDQVYNNVLADLVLQPLYIRKFDSEPRWKLCYNPRARLPGILLVSKAIYSEARECYLELWGPRRIVIDYWYYSNPYKYHARTHHVELVSRGIEIDNVERVLPVLNAVQEFKLEVNALGDDAQCLLLVRWIRAVLNQRPVRLRRISIGVHCNDNGSSTIERRDIIREAREIRTQSQPPGDIWILRRTRRSNVQGPPRGNLLRGDQALEERFLPQSMAWRDLHYGERRRWTVKLWCFACHTYDVFRFHDLWFGKSAGSWRCCVVCAVLHLCCLFDARFAALGWPSTRA